MCVAEVQQQVREQVRALMPGGGEPKPLPAEGPDLAGPDLTRLNVMGLEEAGLDLTRLDVMSLEEAGLDSLAVLTLRDGLERHFGVELDTREVSFLSVTAY